MRRLDKENDEFNFSEDGISENVLEAEHADDLVLSETDFENSSTPKFNSKILTQKDMNIKKNHTVKPRQVEHAEKFEAVKKQKIKDLKVELENKIMEECTFKPLTNRSSSYRNLKEFLQSQQRHTDKINQKQMNIRKKIQEQHRKNTTFSPAINKSITKGDKQIVHQRLYKLKDKAKKINIYSQNLHTPKITERSTNIQRNRPIDELLYQDAQRRMSKQNQYPQEQVKHKAKDYKKDKYAAQKFLKQYYNVCERHQFTQFQELTYNQFNEVLKQLGYIKYSSQISNRLALQQKHLIKQAYKFISKYRLNSYNICTFLLAVGGLYEICLVDDENSENTDQSCLILSEIEGKKIHSQFDLLFRNKLSTQHTKKPIKIEENSFTPQINQESTLMAERYRDKMIDRVNKIFLKNEVNITLPENGVLNHEDLLVIHNIGKNLEKDRQREMNSIKPDPQCTFQPNTSRNQYFQGKLSYRSGIDKSNELYEYAKVKKENEKNRLSSRQQISEKEQQSKVEAFKKPSQLLQPSSEEDGCKSFRQIKDVDKAVARMFQGRKMRAERNQFLARGEPNSNKPLSKIKSKRKLNGKINADEKHTTSQIVTNDPFLVVDINLDEELTHLYFYDGDETRVQKIVGKFCKANNIDEDSQKSLVSMVKKQISKILQESVEN